MTQASNTELDLTEEVTTTDTGVPEAPSEYNGIMIVATPEFKLALKTAAEAADMSLSAFSRQILAEKIGYTGPMAKESKKARKYATEEERQKAQQTRNKARRDVIKALLEKYGGDITAQVDAQVAATEATLKVEHDLEVDEDETDESEDEDSE